MELGGAFGPIQTISDFIYLISAVISSDFRANRTRFHPCRTPRGYKIVILPQQFLTDSPAFLS